MNGLSAPPDTQAILGKLPVLVPAVVSANPEVRENTLRPTGTDAAVGIPPGVPTGYVG